MNEVEQYRLVVMRRTLVPNIFEIFYNVDNIPSAIGTADGIIGHLTPRKKDLYQALLFMWSSDTWTPIKGNVDHNWQDVAEYVECVSERDKFTIGVTE